MILCVELGEAIRWTEMFVEGGVWCVLIHELVCWVGRGDPWTEMCWVRRGDPLNRDICSGWCVVMLHELVCWVGSGDPLNRDVEMYFEGTEWCRHEYVYSAIQGEKLGVSTPMNHAPKCRPKTISDVTCAVLHGRLADFLLSSWLVLRQTFDFHVCIGACSKHSTPNYLIKHHEVIWVAAVTRSRTQRTKFSLKSSYLIYINSAVTTISGQLMVVILW